MKKILCLLVIITFLLCTSLSISASVTMDTDRTLYATQPIVSLYVNEVGTYLSSPTFNVTGYNTGLSGSGDTLTSNQHYQLTLGQNHDVYGEYGVIESLVYLPMSYSMYCSNGVTPFDLDARYFTYFSDLYDFHKQSKPTYRGSCTFYFESDGSMLEAFTIDLTALDIECEKLPQGYVSDNTPAIYNYVYTTYSSECYVFRLHSPQWYAYTYAISNGVPISKFDSCVAYTLNNCVVEHNFADDGVVYMMIGTKLASTIPDMEGVTKLILANHVYDATSDMFQEDTWLEDVSNALDEVDILGISFLTWFYVIFGISVFGYVMKLLMGG